MDKTEKLFLILGIGIGVGLVVSSEAKHDY